MRIKSGFLTIFLTFLLSACGAGAPSDPLGVSPAGGGDSSTQPTTPMSVSIEQFFNQPDPTTIAPVKFKITFSRSIDPGSFFIGDITQSGTATGVTWTMTGPHGNFYNLFASATGSGTIIPTIAEDSVMDTFGNRNLASTSSDNSVTYNYNPLSVSIDQKVGQDDPTCTLPIEFDIVFAQAIDPATFDTSDINQNGTASGITWNLINSGDDTNFTLQATAVTTPGTIIPSLGANAAQTTSLVPNIPSSSTDNNIVFTTDLTVNIEQALAQADPALGLPISYDVKFCRAINSGTFTTADINQDGSASGITWNIVNSGDDISFTLEATAVTTGGTLQPSISANAVQDPGAANNIISNSSDNSVLYDNKVEVTLEQKIGQSDPTSSLPVEFTVTFENAIDPATFSALDIQQNGTATGITWNIINSGDDTVFTLQATAISGQGSVIPSIPANGVADPSSTPNGNSTSIDNEVKYHTTFDATVEQKVGQDDPTASLPLEFTVTFSEAIDASTFNPADITQNGSATGITWNLINSGDDTIFTLQATAVSGEGTVIPTLASSVCQTTYGANNNISTAVDNSILYSTTFSVTVDQKVGQPDPANILPIEFDVVFEREIDALTFTTTDIVQNGTATGVNWNIINSGDDINFTLQATSVTADGTITPSINATLITDTGGADNLASTSTDNEVTYENILVVNIEQKGIQSDPTNSLPIEYDVVFNRAIDSATFTPEDITQSGSATGVTWTVTNSGDDINFTLVATAVGSDGTVTPTISAGLIDLQIDSSIKNQLSTATDNEVTYDTTPPVVLITTPVAPGTWHSTTIDVSGTCDESGGTVNIQLGGSVNDTANCDGANWSKNGVDISSLGDALNISITADLDDAAGNSATTDSEDFNKDTIAPSDVTAVTLTASNDALFTESHTTNWSVATDADSGLSHYMYAIGTSAGAEDKLAYKNIGSVLTYQALVPGDMPIDLLTGQDYFVSIKAIDNAGNESSVLSSPAWQVFNWIKVTGSQCVAGTNLNQATASPMQWSSSTTPSGYFSHSTTVNSHLITIDQAGDYNLNLILPMSGAVQRATVASQVFINGTPLDYGVGQGTYIRNLGGHTESNGVMNIHLNSLSVNDTIEVRVSQVAAAGTITSAGASVYMEYIKPADTIFSATGTQVSAGTNLNQASPFLWDTEIIKDSGFTHTANSQNITLDNTGDYLVYVNIPLSGSATRAAPQLHLKLDGAQVLGGKAAQGYIRNNGGANEASLHFSGLVSATAGQVLSIDMFNEGGAGTITVPAGLKGHIFIQKMNNQNNLISLRGTNTTAGADWNTSVGGTEILWANQDIYDNVVYTHAINSQTITVGEDGNYLLVYNDHLTAASAQRPNPKIRIKIDGTPVSEASCSSHYIRQSGHQESSCSMVFMLDGLTTGQNITLDSILEAVTGVTTAASDAKILLIKKNE